MPANVILTFLIQTSNGLSVTQWTMDDLHNVPHIERLPQKNTREALGRVAQGRIFVASMRWIGGDGGGIGGGRAHVPRVRVASTVTVANKTPASTNIIKVCISPGDDIMAVGWH